MTVTSSRLAPASTMEGMLFFSPLLSSMNLIMGGTTTAGETAARIQPRMAASMLLIPSMEGARRKMSKASQVAGRNPRSKACLPTWCRLFLERLSPERSRITISAMRRRSALAARRVGSRMLSTAGPRATPTAIIPTRGGRPMRVQNHSASRHNRMIRARLTAIDDSL